MTASSPVWMFYKSKYDEVVARSVMNGEDFTDVEISPEDLPEKGDIIIANLDFSSKRLMKYKMFVAMFRQIRRDKK